MVAIKLASSCWTLVGTIKRKPSPFSTFLRSLNDIHHIKVAVGISIIKRLTHEHSDQSRDVYGQTGLNSLFLKFEFALKNHVIVQREDDSAACICW